MLPTELVEHRQQSLVEHLPICQISGQSGEQIQKGSLIWTLF